MMDVPLQCVHYQYNIPTSPILPVEYTQYRVENIKSLIFHDKNHNITERMPFWCYFKMSTNGALHEAAMGRAKENIDYKMAQQIPCN